MPSMNYSFAEKDGKPTLVKPEHVNLGLAIDLVKPNGDRQLVVAGIKKAETLNFFEFWQAYEDIVRRARDEQADDGRLHRRHGLPDQPRRHRHRALRAAPDARPVGRSWASARWSTRPSSRAPPRTP